MSNTPDERQRRQDEVMAFLGRTLVLLQKTEEIVRFCMTFVLQRQPLTSLDILEKQTAEEARRPLGHFLLELRKRAVLEEKFDENLRQFLELRNQFAHRLHSVEGLNFQTIEGLTVATAYIGRVAGLSDYVLKAFMGLLLAWQEEVGLQVPFPHNEDFLEIDRIYKPAADGLFSAKAQK